MYAALYVALVVVFEPISFGFFQVRIANVMVATVPLLGFAGVLGQAIGVFSANLFSPELGLIDLLNTLPSFIMTFVVYYVYKKTNNNFTVIATCIAYSAVIGVTVGWMLHHWLRLPLFVGIASVTAGNIVASVVIGWPLFMLLKRLGIQKLIDKET
jgi:uncharacterized membrane protein